MRVAMTVRGIKTVLKRTAPGKLVRSKKYTCYRAVTPSGRATGPKLRGVAKRLECTVWSTGTHALPSLSSEQTKCRGTAWRGANGGLRRGKAVDSQVSRLAKLGEKARMRSSMLKLTRMTFLALKHYQLEPIDSQRVVIDRSLNLGTAIDVLCLRGDSELVVVELKSGYLGDRTAAAVSGMGRCMMKSPLATASDSTLHRHLAQLAATLALFMAEAETIASLQTKGIHKIGAVLLYINDEASELHELPHWWRSRGARLLGVCGAS